MRVSVWLGFIVSCWLGFNLAIDPIEIRGSKFFNKVTGNQFFFKGITYQPTINGTYDPLAIPKFCSRDVAYMKELGINAIRVKESHPWNDHTACMRIFRDNGIYVVLDLLSGSNAIHRVNPKYDLEMFDYIKSIVDEFYYYDNLVLFIIANEVINSWETTGVASYVKGALRDAKQYLRTLPRYVPVGYADMDLPFISEHTRAFMACGDINHRADFYGINLFSWCGESDMEKSNYKQKMTDFSNTAIPVLISEYGCNDYSPRPFTEINAIYGDEMTKVFSGGFVHEYSNGDSSGKSKFGLVSIDQGQVEITQDYENVKSLLNFVNPTEISREEYLPLVDNIGCPQVTKHWLSSNNLPPTPSEFACNCVEQTLSCRAIATTDENELALAKKIAFLCTLAPCHKINTDSRVGSYGKYSYCSAAIQNSIVFSDTVKIHHDKCDFDDFGIEHTPLKNVREENCDSYPNLSKPSPLSVPANDRTRSLLRLSENLNYSSPTSSAPLLFSPSSSLPLLIILPLLLFSL